MANPFSKKELKFSFITPVYKKTYKTLDKYLNALFQSDYKNFEIIISFDGPNKQGVVTIKKLIDKYKELDIKYIVNEWGGAPVARNHGAKIATGDILVFPDPDCYIYPESLRIWANAFELHPEKDVVWGFYEIPSSEGTMTVPFGGSVPADQQGNFDYYAMKSTNYISGVFPVRKSAFVGWGEGVKSLQDWDMWFRMLMPDFKGDNFLFVPRPFFSTDPVRADGISADSASNWIERRNFVLNRNGYQSPKICVTSLGAPLHALHVAKKLGADYLPMPSFKPHEYKMIYLLGFYPEGARGHAQVFEGFEGKKVVHWIGSDIFGLQYKVGFKPLKALKAQFKSDKFIMLTEAEFTQKEMEEIGIKTKVIPIPPKEINEIMPLPEEFAVGIYENPTQKMYMEELMEKVVRLMPDVKFYFFGDEAKKGYKGDNFEHLGWIDVKEWLPKLSCNLRLTIHDGLPLTPLQFITAGRHVVTNVPLKHAEVTTTEIQDVIDAIRKVKKLPVNTEGSKYWSKELDFDKFKKSIEGLL